MKLPEELLEELNDQSVNKNDSEKTKKIKIDLTSKSKKLEESVISDFIPLKTYK